MIRELDEAIEKSDAEGVHVALFKNFENVEVQIRNEPFFFFHYRCCNPDEKPFFVRFGWSALKQKWIYEALYDD